MADDPAKQIYYKRSRFSSRLPADRLYAPSHFWMREVEAGLWQVGFTKFATRMLGDFVEHGFNVKPDDPVSLGQAIGWVEGFKALTDLYCVVDGAFAGGNVRLQQDVTLADSDPYGAGWLYAVRGRPDPNAVDVQGYASMLDLTIDRMQEKAAAGPPPDCA
jgi:glycine cleavage system H protein